MEASNYTREPLKEKNTYIPANALFELYTVALHNFPRLKDYKHPLTELVSSILTKVGTQTNNAEKLNRQVGVILEYFQILCSEMERCPDAYPIKLGVINRLRGALNKLRREVKDLPTNKKKISSTYARIERELGPSLQEAMTTVNVCEDVSAKLCNSLYEDTTSTIDRDTIPTLENPQNPNDTVSNQDSKY